MIVDEKELHILLLRRELVAIPSHLPPGAVASKERTALNLIVREIDEAVREYLERRRAACASPLVALPARYTVTGAIGG